MIAKIYRFIRYNEHKCLTVKAWFYSAVFRFQMLYADRKKLSSAWGIEGQETSFELKREQYKTASQVAYAVGHVCSKTKWESKCLVRALTAQRLLTEKGIDSTMYLGVGYDENKKMVAHAWLRAGRMYVTGGDGSGYAVVDKFKAKIRSGEKCFERKGA